MAQRKKIEFIFVKTKERWYLLFGREKDEKEVARFKDVIWSLVGKSFKEFFKYDG